MAESVARCRYVLRRYRQRKRCRSSDRHDGELRGQGLRPREFQTAALGRPRYLPKFSPVPSALAEFSPRAVPYRCRKFGWLIPPTSSDQPNAERRADARKSWPIRKNARLRRRDRNECDLEKRAERGRHRSQLSEDRR